MLFALLSPAKKLDFSPLPAPVKPTTPALLKDMAHLAGRTKKYTAANLKRLMHLSPKLAELNFARFQTLDPKNRGETKPAIYAFAGDVYLGFDAKTLSPDEIAFAQDHIGILSGLYGVLRPLDAIQPYRLEMGTAVDTDRGKSLYDFWRDPLTAQINRVTGRLTSPTVINLASDEYWSAIKADQLIAPVIQPVFKDIKNGKAMFLSFFAKKARGLMARYIVQQRLDTPDGLKSFDGLGYTYDAKVSDGSRWVFSRKTK